MIMCLGKREVSPQTPPVEIPQAYSYSPHPNIAVLQCTSHIPQSGPTLACTFSHCIQLAFSLQPPHQLQQVALQICNYQLDLRY